jgi:hypothetical protein
MTKASIKKFILPPGPILSLTLIGLVILGALLYYQAVKIQRFLEPALAVSQPKMRFTQNITNLLSKEFGEKEIRGVKFRAGSILVERTSFMQGGHYTKGFEPEILTKLSHVFLSALANEDLREHISLVMVGIRFPLGPSAELNRMLSLQTQQQAWLLLNSLYAVEPRLESEYGTYFVAAALPVKGAIQENDWIEFRIVPSDRLHIEVLQKFEKYMW